MRNEGLPHDYSLTHACVVVLKRRLSFFAGKIDSGAEVVESCSRVGFCQNL